MRTTGALVLLAAVLLAGCGGDDSTDKSSAADQAKKDAGALLDSWRAPLLAELVLQRDRAQADRGGDAAKASTLWRQAITKLRPIEKFGRDARKHLIDAPRTPVVTATISAGDGWTQWASTLRTATPRGNFTQARHIADLGAEAIVDGPTPSILVPVRAFRPATTTVTAPPRTYTVRDGTIAGTRTFSLRMTLRKYVVPQLSCRGPGPHRGFVCRRGGHVHGNL